MFKKVMNYFVIMALALSSASVFTACGDDDDKDRDEDEPGNVVVTSSIVGEWRVTHASGWEKKDGVIVDEWEEDCDDYSWIYEFSSDGTMTESYEGYADFGTYTYRNDKIIMNLLEDGVDPYTKTGTCQISGNRMKLTFVEKYTEHGASYEDYEVLDLIRINR